MSDGAPPSPASTPRSQRVPKRRRRLSPIWAIPIVAALIALFLGYRAYTQQGPSVTVTFLTASGLEAGQTKVKHKNVDMGTVESVRLSSDLGHVIVTLSMSPSAAPYMRANPRFWVVRPRLSIGGVSGLDTLVSGSYIEMDPGDGPAEKSFRGLEEPPVVRADTPGREFILESPKLGSLGPGSPVFYRGIQVGEVLGYDLGAQKSESSLQIPVFVRAPYDDLVYDRTRFWNASGISISTGSQGFSFKMESLQSLLAGGVVFATPDSARTGSPSKEGQHFQLYDSEESVTEAAYRRSDPFLVYFDGSMRGLSVGAPVELRGLQIGEVTDFHLEFDVTKQAFQVPVMLRLQPDRIRIVGGNRPDVPPEQILARLVERGLRAQLRSGSLLTGQLVVALEIFPDAAPAKLDTSGPIPVVPSVPTQLETITKSVDGVLTPLASLPLQDMVGNARDTLKSLNELVSSPQLKSSLTSLDSSLTAIEALAKNANTQMGPLLTSLRSTANGLDSLLKETRSTIGTYGANSQFMRDTKRLMDELQGASRSIRVFADYLERHPEALIRGKNR